MKALLHFLTALAWFFSLGVMELYGFVFLIKSLLVFILVIYLIHFLTIVNFRNLKPFDYVNLIFLTINTGLYLIALY